MNHNQQDKWRRTIPKWLWFSFITAALLCAIFGGQAICIQSGGGNGISPLPLLSEDIQKDLQELKFELKQTLAAIHRFSKSSDGAEGDSDSDSQSDAKEGNEDKAAVDELPKREGESGGGSGVVGLTKPDTSTLTVEQTEERKELFTHIWRTGFWGSESKSGPGSTLPYTENTRLLISEAIRGLGLKNMLDAPCGDGHWIGAVDGIGTTVHYTGADIVPDAAVANMRKYLDRPNMRFVNLDLAVDPLPKNTFDFIHCRDALQHLPLQTCLDIIANFEQTGAKYLITNFYYPRSNNNGVSLADERAQRAWFFEIDPHQPPFNFSKPLMYISEKSDGKHLAVYKLPALGQGDGTQFHPNPVSLTSVVHLT